MAVSPFEDPRKTSMRERLLVALDAAGYTLVDEPESIDLPAGSDLQGAIIGDVQCVDGTGCKYACYLRPEASKPLPQWLANLAMATAELDGVQLYVVVEEVTEMIEKTTRASGAGLLRLTDADTLEEIVIPAELNEQKLRAELQERAKDLRRRMETKLQLKMKVLEDSYAGVSELTANMTDAKRDSYISAIEKSITQCQGWGDEISTDLDEAAATGTAADLDAIEATIEAEPE